MSTIEAERDAKGLWTVTTHKMPGIAIRDNDLSAALACMYALMIRMHSKHPR